jgi:DNA helicase-4
MNTQNNKKPVYINLAFYSGETELQKRFELQKDLHLGGYSNDSYLTQTFQRQTCLHLAAAHGGIDYIPKGLLTPENMAEQDAFSNNVLHIAAKTGRLLELPLGDIPIASFLAKNNEGESVFYIAEANGIFEFIPELIKIWEPQYLQKKLNEWCDQGEKQLIPQELDNPDIWKYAIPAGVSQYTTALHIVAERRVLCHLPLSLTEGSSMLIENSKGETALSLVIAAGDLKANLIRVPQDFDWSSFAVRSASSTYYHLLAEYCQLGLIDNIPDYAYLLRDKSGNTVLDLLFKSGEIEAAPAHIRWQQREYREKKSKALLSVGRVSELPENFSWHEEMSDGTTPLHYAASEGLLHFLPGELINESNLITRDRNGNNVATVAFHSGNIHQIPVDLRHLASGYAESLLRMGIESGNLADLPAWVISPEYLLRECNAIAKIHMETYLHRIAAKGLLGQIPPNCIQPIHLRKMDWERNTVLHTLVASGYAHTAPALWFTEPEVLSLKNKSGHSIYDLAAGMPMLGRVPVSIFTKDILLAKCGNGKNRADLIEEHGNIALLSTDLRNLSKSYVYLNLEKCFRENFFSSKDLYLSKYSHIITMDQFIEMRRNFVRDWFIDREGFLYDDEQVDAIADYGSHIKVTGRAGSGKTRILMARAVFQIQHCLIPAKNIIIFAFNQKAVKMIRERLSMILSEEQIPHIMTFRDLACSIVNPDTDSIFDNSETIEDHLFNTRIQRIVDFAIRSGLLEEKCKELIKANWRSDLKEIIEKAFNLKHSSLYDYSENFIRTTIDGRSVVTEAQKNVGNAIFRLGLRYFFRRFINADVVPNRNAQFVVYNDKNDQNFFIEIIENDRLNANSSIHNYLMAGQSHHEQLLQLQSLDCLDQDIALKLVMNGLSKFGVIASPMSDDEIWLILQNDIILRFSNTVKEFICRCKKERIYPDKIERMIPASDPELWGRLDVSPHRMSVSHPTVGGMQARFWRLCSWIYKRCAQDSETANLTDFDQLMLDAAKMIKGGSTEFSSANCHGDIRQIQHVMIDDYQDLPHLWNELVKSILVQSPNTQFFCVGDEWQATSDFAGSDLRYVTDFSKTFQPAAIMLLKRNYRSHSKIVDIGNQLMKGKGPSSVSKSSALGHVWHVTVGSQYDVSEVEQIVIDELGENALIVLRIASTNTSRGDSVVVLTRTTSVVTPEGMNELEVWQEKLRSFLPEKDRSLLEVSTIHDYKGREADVAILVDPNSYPLMHYDLIYNKFFGDTFNMIEDREKRLFYVGVTRSRKSLFFLSYPDRHSKRSTRKISFLGVNSPSPFDIDQLQSNLISGSRICVRIMNQNGILGNGGIFSIMDHLKKLEFKWNNEREVWSIFLKQGVINTPHECIQYLNAQPWLKEADGIVASFSWESQQYEFFINRGVVASDNSAQSVCTLSQSISEQKDENNMQQSYPETYSKLSAPTTQIGSGLEVHHTRVAGVTYDNRVHAIRLLSVGETITLMRRPHNPKDANAIEVLSTDSFSLGYIPATLAAEIAPQIDQLGGEIQATVKEIQPGEPVSNYLSLFIRFELPRLPVITNLQPSLASLIKPSSLTSDQDKELSQIEDCRLRQIITELYISGTCELPVIGFESQASALNTSNSKLEIAWPNLKVGIYMPSNNVTAFVSTGWIILPTSTVSVEILRSVLSSAIQLASACSSAEPHSEQSPTGTQMSGEDFIDAITRIRSGAYLNGNSEDNIPF